MKRYPPFRLPVKSYPDSIFQDWRRFYYEFPEVYDEFVCYQDYDGTVLDSVRRFVSIRGAVVADVGSGTGKYAFDMAAEAGHIHAVEPCLPMQERARQRASLNGDLAEEITFLDAEAADIPLPDNSVDIVFASHSLTAIHARDVIRGRGMGETEVTARFEAKMRAINEMMRILRPRGWFFSISASPNGFGGDLMNVVLGDKAETWASGKRYFLDWMKSEYGFQDLQIASDWRFPSADIAARSFGFIFGVETIGTILGKGITRIKNPVVLQWRQKE